MHDLIIIGGGPAGLAASVYAAERQLDYLLLSRELGGKCNYRIRPLAMEEPSQVTAKDIVTIYKSKLECLRHSYRLETVTSVSHDNGVFSVTTDKPRPVPLPTSLVVKKGSKSLSRFSGAIPRPESSITISIPRCV